MTNVAVPSLASTTPASSASSTNSSSSASAAASMTQSDFLQLLTAQLQYQSPSSPASATDLAQEFAEISTVDGIDQLNTQVGKIQSSSTAAQMAQAASLVGKQVAVSGSALTANAAGDAEGAFNLGSAAKSVDVTIYSSSGKAVKTLDLGAMGAGQQTFDWSSAAAGGQYTYQVSANSSAGAAVSVTPYSLYTVEGVNVSGSAPTLNVQGLAKPLAISSVESVLGGAAS
jgi:flagellar basal-body rod modification protein FlgD